MAQISCQQVVKSFGQATVVHGVDLDVMDNEFVVLLGPSGCGKSTILRMIAGLEEITSGVISIGDRVVNDLLPRDRNVAMVFQNYALYPHMSVYDNIAFGLRRLKTPKPEIDRRVNEVAAVLRIEALLDRRPAELSGGEQQRVAIARAMIKTPAVFLFDEPLSNLDAKLRHHMRVEIARLHQRLGATTIYVTHDQLEAMTLADRIVLLKDGRIEQVATPREIFEKPRTQFAASFIGTPAINFLEMNAFRDKADTVLKRGDTAIRLPSERLARRRWRAGGCRVPPRSSPSQLRQRRRRPPERQDRSHRVSRQRSVGDVPGRGSRSDRVVAWSGSACCGRRD